MQAVQFLLGLLPGDSRVVRVEEPVLTRGQIGHTNTLHSFILRKGILQIEPSDYLLTVKYISIEGVDCVGIRNSCLGYDAQG